MPNCGKLDIMATLPGVYIGYSILSEHKLRMIK